MKKKRLIIVGVIGGIASVFLFFSWLDFSSQEYSHGFFKMAFAFFGYGLAAAPEIFYEDLKLDRPGAVARVFNKLSRVFTVFANFCLVLGVIFLLV